MEVNAKKLAKALYDIKEIHGISWKDVTERSDVHNLGRIVHGQITPTAASWSKLHSAYPEFIPPVEFSHDGKVYKNVTVPGNNNTTTTAGNNLYQNDASATTMTTSQKYACDLIIQADEEKVKEVIRLLLN